MKMDRETGVASEVVRIYLKCMRAKISIVLDGFYQNDLGRELSEEHAFGIKEILESIEDDLCSAKEHIEPIIVEDQKREHEEAEKRTVVLSCQQEKS